MKNNWRIIEFLPTGKDPLLTRPYRRLSYGRYRHPNDPKYPDSKTSWSLQEMLHDENASVSTGDFKITVVKRLTDNTIWNAGEVVNCKLKSGPIEKFQVDEKNLEAKVRGIWYDLGALCKTP